MAHRLTFDVALSQQPSRVAIIERGEHQGYFTVIARVPLVVQSERDATLLRTYELVEKIDTVTYRARRIS